MTSLQFPLMCWPIGDESVAVQILGTSHSVVAAEKSKVKRVASEALLKLLRDGEDIYAPDIVEPGLQFHSVEVQLSFKDKQGIYPLSHSTRLRVAAVYGFSTEAKFGQCILPYLGQSFYYYDKAQLKSLIQHFARDTLESAAPDDIYRYIMPTTPFLEVININRQKILPARERNQQQPEVLLQVTDQIPIDKRERQQIGRIPEAAWERNELVSGLATQITDSVNCKVVVGAQGVGKTTVLLEAIKTYKRLHKGEEETLTFWRTTSQRLIGKAKYLGEWQAICDEIVEALQAVNGILWITDLAQLMRIGGESAEDSVAAYLQPYIVKGKLRIIAELLPQEIEVARSQLPSFIHLFESFPIPAMEKKAALTVMHQYANYGRLNFGIDIGEPSIDLAFQLVNRYIKHQAFPGKGISFLSDCFKMAHFESKKQLDDNEILRQFAKNTGLPDILLRDEIALSTDDLRAYFSDKIKGQDATIDSLCRVVQTFKSGLNDPDKPIATLLFAGPTGVGKTAAAKVLANYFFHSGQTRQPLFSVDMSEFQHPLHIERLIGGEDKPSALIQHVRNNPFSVVLFDEIEKAHTSIYDALLTLLDEGLLTDRFGRVTDFRNTIIVMTTNLGVQKGTAIGFHSTAQGQVALSAVRGFFRPEFYNRIDDVFCFATLSQSVAGDIVLRELELLSERDQIKEAGMTLSFDDTVISFIIEKGFSPVYGARPLQRAIERYIVGPLAGYLLKKPAQLQIRVFVSAGNMEFTAT